MSSQKYKKKIEKKDCKACKQFSQKKNYRIITFLAISFPLAVAIFSGSG